MSDTIEARAQDDQHQATAAEQVDTAMAGSLSPEGGITQNTDGNTPGSGPTNISDIQNVDDYEQMLTNRDLIMGMKEPDNFGALVTDTGGFGGEAQPEAAEEVATGNEQGDAVNQEGQSEGDHEDGKRPQYRLRPANDVDEEALRLIKAARAAGEELSLEDGLALAKRKMGIADPFATQAAKTPDAANDGDDADPFDNDADILGDLTIDQITERAAELQEEELSAFEDMNMGKVRAVRKELADLNALKEVAIRSEQTKSQQAAVQFDAQFDSAVSKAGSLFPDFMNEGTEFYARCREVDDLLKQTNDPRYQESGKPLMIAQMVAKEMGVLPTAATRGAKLSTAAQAQPTRQSVAITPKPARVEMTALPNASGASRTQTPANASTIADRVEKIHNTEDWETFERELAGRR